MYDAPDWDENALPVGLRYEGMRKPSQIFEAIEPDMEWVCDKALEDEHDWTEITMIRLQFRAFRLLVSAEPDLDITIEDEDTIIDVEPDALAIATVVQDRFDNLSVYAPAFCFYGWASEDRDEPGFNALGVWPNWDAINKAVGENLILEVDSYEQLVEDKDEIKAAKYSYAIMEEDGETILFDVDDCLVVWRF